MNAAGSGPAATGIEGASAPAIKVTKVASRECRNMAVNLFGVKLLGPGGPQGAGSRSRAEQPTINVSNAEAVALYELVRCCSDL